MGGGYYNYDEHEAATLARAELSEKQVFKQGSCHPDMNPFGVTLRESRDSDEHPNSRSVIFAFDVSGSMGEIPVTLALKTLPTFMRNAVSILPDAQVLFMAVGNAFESRSPLQVGQFESSDERIDHWLSAMHLEGGGDWNGESYDLAMYFAAHHTSLDCFEKRGEKGYFFMTGDEVWYVASDKAKVAEVIGDSVPENIPIDDVVDALARMYHPFFLIPDPHRARKDSVEKVWRRLLGDCVIVLQSPQDTATAAATLIGIREGRLPDAEAITGQLIGEFGLPEADAARILEAVLPYAEAVARGDGDPPTTRPPIVESPPRRQAG